MIAHTASEPEYRFNVQHFHEMPTEEYGLRIGYTGGREVGGTESGTAPGQDLHRAGGTGLHVLGRRELSVFPGQLYEKMRRRSGTGGALETTFGV